MIRQLADWKGRVSVNGVEYNSIREVPTLSLDNTTVITLFPVTQTVKTPVKAASDEVEHIITVRRYMTEKSSDGFDFMKKWNDNIPMPMRTMVGTVVKETKGMVYMKLHGDYIADRMYTCMCCGKKLTNPVSQFFGVGPECGGHNYVHPFNTDEELKAAVDAYRSVLVNKTWEGWVIRSSIIRDEIREVSND